MIDGNGTISSCSAFVKMQLQEEERQRLFIRQMRERACASGVQAHLWHSASPASETSAASDSSLSGVNVSLTSRAVGPAAEFRTVPPLCTATLLQLQRDSKLIALTYTDAEVMVEIVTIEEAEAMQADAKGDGAGELAQASEILSPNQS